MGDTQDKNRVTADRKTSPSPDAHVARVPSNNASAQSATLIPRSLGYLIIKVAFHRMPTAGLAGKLWKANADGSAAESMGEPVITDKDGIARLDAKVPAG